MGRGRWRTTAENAFLDVLAVVVGAQFGLWGEADWRAKPTLLALVTFCRRRVVAVMASLRPDGYCVSLQ